MTQGKTISLIIVTKNRAQLLSHCLSSLMGQLKNRDEIVIIDNGSTDETSTVIASFAKKLTIHAFPKPKGTFPQLYNSGVAQARGDIVVFFDDDCRATPDFLDNIRRAHTKHPNTVIQGLTKSIPKGNIYADIMGDHYANWIATMLIDNNNHMRTFDNKNASIPRALFTKFHGFSPAMSRGSEDIELGLRLRRNGIPIILDRTILAYHHERTTLAGFLAQHRRFALSEGYLDRVVEPSERLGIIPKKKLFLHMKSVLRREMNYLTHWKLNSVLLLPFLYLALAWIRFTRYHLSR